MQYPKKNTFSSSCATNQKHTISYKEIYNFKPIAGNLSRMKMYFSKSKFAILVRTKKMKTTIT